MHWVGLVKSIMRSGGQLGQVPKRRRNARGNGMIDCGLQRIVLRGKRHAEEQREHAHDGRGQMENFPGHIPSSILYMVLLIWLLASAAKSGLRDPIKCVAPAGHRSLERSHSLL